MPTARGKVASIHSNTTTPFQSDWWRHPSCYVRLEVTHLVFSWGSTTRCGGRAVIVRASRNVGKVKAAPLAGLIWHGKGGYWHGADEPRRSGSHVHRNVRRHAGEAEKPWAPGFPELPASAHLRALSDWGR